MFDMLKSKVSATKNTMSGKIALAKVECSNTMFQSKVERDAKWEAMKAKMGG